MSELKTQFIEAVRLTPDGILNFLETPIPTPPTINLPSDVDAAIVANGVCAKFICDLFRPFAGLTPIELLLRIGQHNNILESAMVAGLEYLGAEADDGEQSFSIVEPEAGTAYRPGNLRLIAQADNGSILQVAVEIGGAAPVALAAEDGISFYGFARLEDEGEYTATFTALFDDESTQTASVSFSIATDAAPGEDEPENPDGSDLNAVNAAKAAFDAAVNAASKAADAGSGVGDRVVAAAQALAQSGSVVLRKIGETAGKCEDDLADAIDGMADVLSESRTISRAIQLDDLFMAKLAAMNSAGAAYHAAVIATYWQNNQHPTGGYTSCPEVLRGAAIAMNEKYGPGTVTL